MEKKIQHNKIHWNNNRKTKTIITDKFDTAIKIIIIFSSSIIPQLYYGIHCKNEANLKDFELGKKIKQIYDTYLREKKKFML